jgi:hypothetical protein
LFVAKGKDGENIGQENLICPALHNSMQPKNYGKDGRDIQHASNGKHIRTVLCL